MGSLPRIELYITPSQILYTAALLLGRGGTPVGRCHPSGPRFLVRWANAEYAAPLRPYIYEQSAIVAKSAKGCDHL